MRFCLILTLSQGIAMAHKSAERGDTLVEVLMAIVILSMVIVGAIAIMSRGLQSAQTAVEHTQVRFGINEQTELLRYLRDGYLQDRTSAAGLAWAQLFGPVAYADANVSRLDTACQVTSGKRGFYLENTGGVVVIKAFSATSKPDTSAIAGKGLWVEATLSPASISPAYIDFQIRACWLASGNSAQQETVTGVRLYDPAH